MSDLAALEQRYETCERAYLNGIRASESHAELRRLAGAVAAACASWNDLAHERLRETSGDEREPLELLTERTEVLTDLWTDIQSAYGHEQDALFSVTRSLWDRITPNLRGVAYSAGDSELRVRLLFADAPSVSTVEMVSDAEGECIADFWQSHAVSYSAVHLPMDRPRDLEPGEHWVYLRHEPPRTI